MSRDTHQHLTKAELTEDIRAVAKYARDESPDDIDRRARIFVAAMFGRFERQYPEIAAALNQVIELEPMARTTRQ